MSASLLVVVLVAGGDRGGTRRGRSDAAAPHTTAGGGPIHARRARGGGFTLRAVAISPDLPDSPPHPRRSCSLVAGATRTYDVPPCVIRLGRQGNQDV